MISLTNDQLAISFPDVSDNAGVRIDFQRTLRLPDDGRGYHLPPGFGRFPLRKIEDYDFGENNARKERGGIIMPIFQTDALWLNFNSFGFEGAMFPVALKIGAGKINAVSGKKWSEGLSQNPQDYVVLPGQPWLDGFNVAKGVVRQFVAMPLGQGYTVEEQIDADSEVGGIQIEAFPMKARRYKELVTKVVGSEDFFLSSLKLCESSPALDMGLGMGGSMSQEIFDDEYGLDAWDLEKGQRCFVMLANAQQWISITKEEPPLSPISAEQYNEAGLPWFDYFDADKKAIEGAKALGMVRSIKELAVEKRDHVWPEDNGSTEPSVLKVKPSEVSDGEW